MVLDGTVIEEMKSELIKSPPKEVAAQLDKISDECIPV